MGSRKRNSEPARKYHHERPAFILTFGLVLFTLVGIGVGLYNRYSEPHAFYDRVPGVDLTNVDAKQRSAFLQELNLQTCTCGCDMTLGECRNVDSHCPVSPELVQELAMQAGVLRKEAPSNPQ